MTCTVNMYLPKFGVNRMNGIIFHLSVMSSESDENFSGNSQQQWRSHFCAKRIFALLALCSCYPNFRRDKIIQANMISK